MIRGSTLRARRLALGRSVEDVAAATRIPAEHVLAIEDERLDDLPPGPYAAAYVRTLTRALGVDEASEEAPAPPVAPPQGAPLWLVRLMAGTSVIALAVVLATMAFERLQPMIGTDPAKAAIPDQAVTITAKQTTRLLARVDGEVAADRTLAGGETVELTARDRVELEVQALAHVHIVWNGQTLVPQGSQDLPRKLVFLDDAGGAR